MVHILRQYGFSFIFLTVFAESLGLPVPSYPVILVAAGLAAPLHFRLPMIFVVCVLAAMGGDGTWYTLGRSRGRPILRRLCSLSLSPDSCVNRTERLFQRYGIKSLLVAKFVPGLSAIAAPLAGMLKVAPLRFIAADFAGVALWAGSAIALGQVFRTEVEWALEWLGAFGRTGVLILAVLVAGWLLLKWVERRQFYRRLERSRISAPELKQRLERGDAMVIVDLRSDLSYHGDGIKVAGAIWIPPEEFEERFTEIPRGRPVVMYCNCPNEATSASMARLLSGKGYHEVLPLLGGLDRWVELGYPTEAADAPAPGLASLGAASSSA
jgi:membrane protein DedA with SNARE-associated domain/rhodanese-related sulfurtransferase